MIKIEHTLFSLPFVLSAAVLAIYYLSSSSILSLEFWSVVPWQSFVWIALCLLGARSAGMSLNRIIDAEIDARNPRTAEREIPAGKISKTQAWIFTLFSFAFLIYGAFQLPKLCQILLPIPVIWVFVYPYLKRLTWFAHFFLGTTLAGATLGGWIAITGTVDTLAPVYLSLAVCFWVSGFDIIYATQDLDFDREAKLHSVPSVFGRDKALRLARFLHFLTPLFLFWAGESLGLGLIYKLGTLAVIAALFYEQKLVQDGKIEAAFFTVNSWISVLIFVFVLLDLV